ncbi:DUF2975 domain-containing protein [Microbacterium sp. Mu-80]|uniref:DUF2975 domain-containing protein n=1 Tax=Microbacterium bandirmense TaxID=3122050 RepID=A0ABU8LEI2_9MICO
MGRTTIVLLRVVIALALAGSLVVQTVLTPLIWVDLDGTPTWFRVSFVVIAVLVVALAFVMAPTHIAPGIVALVCGAALVLGGMALLVVVMKALLRQAIERGNEAQTLRIELGEVI